MMGNDVLKVRLVDFAQPVRRETTVDALRIYRTIGCHLYGNGVYERKEKTGAEIKAARMFLVEKDDLVINRIWAQKGSAGIVPASLAGAVVTQDFPVWTLNPEKALARYIGWYLKTSDFWDECRRHSHGTSGRERLSPKELPNIMFPLPPIDEQRRIVARIEELSALIEEAQALRVKAREMSDALVASALKEQLEPTSSWQMKRISTCSVMSTGTTPPSHRGEYFDGELQWYTPGDLGFQRDLGPSSRSISELAVTEKKARVFQPGTVLLVAIGGSIGKVGLTHERCSANQQITGIKFSQEILPEYGFWCVRNLYNELRAAAPQATLPIINQRRIGEFEIPVPPLVEQRRLIACFDELQAQVDDVTALQDASQMELDALLPSILDKAFKGEL